MSVFRALRNRNYKLFFFGQVISLTGTWMQMIAVGWLVYRLTNSPLLLGVMGFCSQIPSFFISPFAGVLADRWDLQKSIIIIQTLAMVQAGLLALMFFSGHVSIWGLVALSLFSGFINAFDMPIRQSFVIQMIDHPEDLGNAIALNSSIVNTARLIGPSIGGFIIAFFGEGVCFLLNSLSYIAVIISLSFMSITSKEKKKHENNILFDMKEGLKYVLGFTPLRDIILLIGGISLFGMSFATLTPAFTKDILHVGPQGMGILMATSGIGALFGGYLLAVRKSVRGLSGILAIAPFVLGTGIILLSLISNFYLALLIMIFTGLGMVALIAISNTLLQTIVENSMRGRVMSFYTIAFMGVAPFGSLFAGSIAHLIGIRGVFFLSGALSLLFGMMFYLRLPDFKKKVRPVYIEKGIIENPLAQVLEEQK